MSQSLIEFVKTSEYFRKKFAESLREAQQKVDDQNNQIFESKMNKQLSQISYETLCKKLELLYDSVQKISDTKNIQDKYEIEIKQLRNRIKIHKKEYDNLQYGNQEMFKEWNEIREQMFKLADTYT